MVDCGICHKKEYAKSRRIYSSFLAKSLAERGHRCTPKRCLAKKSHIKLLMRSTQNLATTIRLLYKVWTEDPYSYTTPTELPNNADGAKRNNKQTKETERDDEMLAKVMR